ncbi:MAG TPA: DUF6247 family protein [Pseudonocardiaceae bacterium]
MSSRGARHPLLPGATQLDIRAALLPEDRAAFDVAYAQALPRPAPAWT